MGRPQRILVRRRGRVSPLSRQARPFLSGRGPGRSGLRGGALAVIRSQYDRPPPDRFGAARAWLEEATSLSFAGPGGRATTASVASLAAISASMRQCLIMALLPAGGASAPMAMTLSRLPQASVMHLTQAIAGLRLEPARQLAHTGEARSTRGSQDEIVSVVLACDLGGTNFRAALVDATGMARAECAIPGPPSIDRDASSEIDADRWWETLLACAGRLAAAEPALFAGSRASRSADHPDAGLRRPRRAAAPSRHDLEGHARGGPRRASRRGARPPSGGAADERLPSAGAARLAEGARARDVRRPRAGARAQGLAQFPPDGTACDRSGLDGAAARLPGACGGERRLSRAGLSPLVLPAVVEPQEKVGLIQPGLPAPFDRLAGVPVFGCSNDTWAAGPGPRRAADRFRLQHLRHDRGSGRRRCRPRRGGRAHDRRLAGPLAARRPEPERADTAAWFATLVDASRPKAGERAWRWPISSPDQDAKSRSSSCPTSRASGCPTGIRPCAAPSWSEPAAWPDRSRLCWCWRASPSRTGSCSSGRKRRSAGGARAQARRRRGRQSGLVPDQGRCLRLPPWSWARAANAGTLGAALAAWTGLGRFASLGAAQEAIVNGRPPLRARSGAAGELRSALLALYRQAEAALAPISSALARWRLSPDDLPGIRPHPEFS